MEAGVQLRAAGGLVVGLPCRPLSFIEHGGDMAVREISMVEADKLLSLAAPTRAAELRAAWCFITECWRDGWLPGHRDFEQRMYVGRAVVVRMLRALEVLGVVCPADPDAARSRYRLLIAYPTGCIDTGEYEALTEAPTRPVRVLLHRGD
jgi:hypothetical protein